MTKKKVATKKKTTTKIPPIKEKAVVERIYIKQPPRRIYIKQPPQQVLDETTKNLLIENFVGLQKVVIDLSTKMDELTKNLSKLLSLFESSAESLIKRNFDIEIIDRETREIKIETEKVEASASEENEINEEIDKINTQIEGEKIFTPLEPLALSNTLPEFQRISPTSQSGSIPPQRFQPPRNTMAPQESIPEIPELPMFPEFPQSQNSPPLGGFFPDENIGELPNLPNPSRGGEIPGSE